MTDRAALVLHALGLLPNSDEEEHRLIERATTALDSVVAECSSYREALKEIAQHDYRVGTFERRGEIARAALSDSKEAGRG